MTPIDTEDGLKYFYKYEDGDLIEIGWADLGTEISELGDKFRERAKRKGLNFNIRNEKLNQPSFDESSEPEFPLQ